MLGHILRFVAESLALTAEAAAVQEDVHLLHELDPKLLLIGIDIDGYVATLGITDDDTVYEDCSFIMQPQASMVIMDQTTGEVVAMIGGRGEKTANKTLNRAKRVPGRRTEQPQ